MPGMAKPGHLSCYGGQATGWRGSLPGTGKRFSPLYSVQTDSGAHTAAYPTGNGGPFPGNKTPGYDADVSPNAEVKNVWSYNSNHPYAFRTRYRDNFTFTLPQTWRMVFRFSYRHVGSNSKAWRMR
jgi:hypothetical protein